MSWTFKQIEPQPARGTLREEMWDSPEWIAEEKYDGDRRIAQFCSMVRFTGRRKSVNGGLFVEKTENVPHLSGCWPLGDRTQCETRRLRVPAALEGTVLDGEMIWQPDCCKQHRADVGGHHPLCESPSGGMSKHVTSIMGSLPEEAARKQIERGWLLYVVFDCLFYKGRDVSNLLPEARREYAEDAIEAWRNPFATLAEQAHGASKRRFYDTVTRRGGEGVILKHIDHRYGDKNGWVKVKKTKTADVVIIGTEQAKSESVKKGDTEATPTKYKGMVGALVIGQLRDGKMWQCSTPGKGVSGFSDAVRAEITKRPKKYIGRVIEIEHNGREPTGRFRHPRFNRFRDDKRAADCVYREDES